MKNILWLAIFLCIAELALADSVYLNNGKILKGQITEEDDESIILVIGDKWERIDKEDIDHFSKIRKKDSQPEQTVEFAPKIGCFFPTDKILKEIHNNPCPLLGLNLDYWSNMIGGRLEFEYCRHVDDGRVYLRYYPNGYYSGSYVGYEDTLTLIPIWLSIMGRSSSTNYYFYYGAGLGRVFVSETTSYDYVNNEVEENSNYFGLQAFIGFKASNFGMTLKYSSVESDELFGKIDFGGITGYIDFYF
ncbi:MAG: hypothetical protein PHH44_00505 [bacterium]|nr:hypothetical protein [bacterium]